MTGMSVVGEEVLHSLSGQKFWERRRSAFSRASSFAEDLPVSDAVPFFRCRWTMLGLAPPSHCGRSALRLVPPSLCEQSALGLSPRGFSYVAGDRSMLMWRH